MKPYNFIQNDTKSYNKRGRTFERKIYTITSTGDNRYGDLKYCNK